MPITHLNNTHFTDEEVNKILDALSLLEITALPKLQNLTGVDRQKYGSINEQNKLFVNKVYDFRQAQPNLSAPEIDWDEFMNDYKSRLFKENTINRIDAIRKAFNNSKILHDYDNYQASLQDYAHTTYKAGSNTPGFEAKYKEMKQFFTTSKSDPTTPSPTPEDPALPPEPPTT